MSTFKESPVIDYSHVAVARLRRENAKLQAQLTAAEAQVRELREASNQFLLSEKGRTDPKVSLGGYKESLHLARVMADAALARKETPTLDAAQSGFQIKVDDSIPPNEIHLHQPSGRIDKIVNIGKETPTK